MYVYGPNPLLRPTKYSQMILERILQLEALAPQDSEEDSKKVLLAARNWCEAPCEELRNVMMDLTEPDEDAKYSNFREVVAWIEYAIVTSYQNVASMERYLARVDGYIIGRQG